MVAVVVALVAEVAVVVIVAAQVKHIPEISNTCVGLLL